MLSGRTPTALRKTFTDWPLISAPMAEILTGASRAAVQRNLKLMDEMGLVQEISGQGRFRIWRAGK
jgi:Fic family protein